jgi:penicillin amidase
MAVLDPLLPPTPAADVLRAWDRRYDVASRGAYLFERFYRELVMEVFGTVAGAEVARFVTGETGMLADFYANFDGVLLRADSAWFGPDGRDAVFARVAARTLVDPVRTWGSQQTVMMHHLLLGGRLPAWCGLDHGPVTFAGGRATIQQGQIYRASGRTTSFVPSFRLVTDLGEPAVHTGLAGGPSDRRFSPWYTSGVEDWLAGRLKTLLPTGAVPPPLNSRT